MVRLSPPVLALALLWATAASAQSTTPGEYRVTVKNLTKEHTFTRLIVLSHGEGFHLFELEQPASEALTALGEGGDPTPLSTWLDKHPKVLDIALSEGSVGPGESVTLTLRSNPRADRISVASMVTPTNDGFVALDGVLARALTREEYERLINKPASGRDRVYKAMLFDAGTETNDELCASIPGPSCKGQGASPADAGEGKVRMHPGVTGSGDLTAAADASWTKRVAEVSVRQLGGTAPTAPALSIAPATAPDPAPAPAPAPATTLTPPH